MMSSTGKRKAEQVEKELEDDPQWKVTRIQYRREVYIQRILGGLLGDKDAGPRIDRRIRRFANPVLCYADSLIVRYHGEKEGDESVFLHIDNYKVPDRFTHGDSVLSWSRGLNILYKGNLNEVVLGELFFAFLDDAGQLSAFGEHSGNLTGFGYHFYSINEKPLGREPCIATWAGCGKLFTLTHNEFRVFEEGVDTAINLGNLDPSAILDVYPYGFGAILLTRDGLYKCNDEGLRGTLKVDIHGLGIEKVWTTESAIFVVASDGNLYVNGRGGNGELGIGHDHVGYRHVSTDDEWRLVEFGEPIKSEIAKLGGIQFIGGDTIPNRGRTIIVAGKQLYTTNVMTGLFESVPGNYVFDGDIVSVVAFKDRTMIVATTVSLYLVVTNYYGSGVYKELGGKKEKEKVKDKSYKLLIPYNGKVYDISDGTNKKQRTDLRCTMCFANAVFAYKQKHAICSHYCARKIVNETQ